MSKVLSKIFMFFSNKWTKLGFSLLSVGYGAFLGLVAWLTFAYYFDYENPVALFLMYVFINLLFAIVMIYTRKQLLTQIVALFMHPCILVMLVFGFGNWYLIIPPFVAATVIFFASGANETLKVILGTVYMIIFVLAVIGYMTIQKLTIQIPGKMNFSARQYPEVQVDYKKKKGETAKYRLVMYVDPECKQNRVATYYVEQAELDKKYWFVKCERVFGCSKAASIRIDVNPVIKWKEENVLLINGDYKEIGEDGKIKAVDSDEDETLDGETSIITTPPPMTKSASD